MQSHAAANWVLKGLNGLNVFGKLILLIFFRLKCFILETYKQNMCQMLYFLKTVSNMYLSQT